MKKYDIMKIILIQKQIRCKLYNRNISRLLNETNINSVILKETDFIKLQKSILNKLYITNCKLYLTLSQKLFIILYEIKIIKKIYNCTPL